MLCKIGTVEIWRLLEIHAPFMAACDLFPTAGPDVEQIIETHDPDGICSQSGRLILPIQGFLLKTQHHNILIDSCVGNHKTVPNVPVWNNRSDTRFMAALTAAGLAVDDVDYVLCTHLHTDHVGWNTRLCDGRWVPTFPNARYLMPSADCAFHQSQQSQLYQESVSPVIEAGQADYVEAGHKLGDHVSLISTPGHTSGHVSILISDNGQEAVITGDALHSTVQCRFPDWHFKFDADPDQAVRSRKYLLETVSEKGCSVLGNHFSLPSIGQVTYENGRFRWSC